MAAIDRWRTDENGCIIAPGSSANPLDSSNFSATIIKDFDEFYRMKNEWAELSQNCPKTSIYQSHEWLCLSWQHCRRKFVDRLRVVLIKERDQLMMAGAFVVTVKGMTRVVKLLGSRAPQTDNILWRPSDHTSGHAQLLLATLQHDNIIPRWFYARRLNSESPLRLAMIDQNLLSIVRDNQISAYLSLESHKSYECWLKSLSANLQKDNSRRQRRLSETSEFTMNRETGSEMTDTLDWLFTQKRAWLKKKSKSQSSLEDQSFDKMYVELINQISPSRVLLMTYRISGKIIAARLGIEINGIVRFITSAYDEKYKSLSPSRTLLFNMIAALFDDRCKELDLGLGTLEWKDRLNCSHGHFVAQWSKIK